MGQAEEMKKRDRVLDALEMKRATAIEIASEVANGLASKGDGTVTSVLVFEEMKRRGHGRLLTAIDPRFMGAVFRHGWTRAGVVRTGSHGRPVTVWAKDAAGASRIALALATETEGRTSDEELIAKTKKLVVDEAVAKIGTRSFWSAPELIRELGWEAISKVTT